MYYTDGFRQGQPSYRDWGSNHADATIDFTFGWTSAPFSLISDW
jgi:hypothetical protein